MELLKIVQPIYDKWSVVPNNIDTHCNQFVSAVMLTQNYHGFEGKTANSIIDIIKFEKSCWHKIAAEEWDCQSLVVAGLKADIHGHVNILLPGDFQQSGKWQKKVPLCANIGKNNFWFKGVNWAFQKEPEYYLYR